MWPISDTGPYYAALVTGGKLDTKGGPKTNPEGQVLDIADQPIPGLYGVGNCVASASGRAYWAGGGTLGPFVGFAYRAANAANGAGQRLSSHGRHGVPSCRSSLEVDTLMSERRTLW